MLLADWVLLEQAVAGRLLIHQVGVEEASKGLPSRPQGPERVLKQEPESVQERQAQAPGLCRKALQRRLEVPGFAP